MAAFVTVYNKSGVAEKHTVANARDLTAHAGYSWKPGRAWKPVDGAPYARPELANAGDKAQEVLDRVGGAPKATVDTTAHDVVRDDDPVLVEEGPEPVHTPVADEPDEDEDEVVEEEAAPEVVVEDED